MTRQDMSEVHGEDFMNEFDKEFEVKPSSVGKSFKLFQTPFLWYIAGALDAVIVYFLYRFLN